MIALPGVYPIVAAVFVYAKCTIMRGLQAVVEDRSFANRRIFLPQIYDPKRDRQKKSSTFTLQKLY